jgi:hypothetical protein
LSVLVLTRIVVPAAIVLAAAIAADRTGADALAFYLCLAGLLVSGAGGFAALGRIVDGATPAALGRIQAALAAVLAAVFFIAAVGRSPGGVVPGLAGIGLAAGIVVCCVLGVVALLPARDERL